MPNTQPFAAGGYRFMPHAFQYSGGVVAEPGYYKTGEYGIRIENLVVVQPWEGNGGERNMLCFETLTLAPIDRALVDLDLLEADEIAWLNAYHARVRAEIGPLVDAETARWLAEATGPLRSG